MTLNLLFTLLFLCLNIFFVLAEFALVKAQRPRLQVMKNEGRTRASLVINMMENLDNYLSAIQIGVTMSTLALGWAGEPVVARIVEKWIHYPPILAVYGPRITTFLAFCLIIYVQIVFAELLPRSIAIQKPERIALWVAIPLAAFYKALRGPILLMAKSSMFVSRLIGLKPVGEHTEVFTEDEVRVLLGMSQEKGLLPLDRLLLIENVLDFADLKVKDAMIPREKLVFLSTAATWEENLSVLRANHFSRYPLADPDLDHVTSFVHVKDLARDSADEPNLKSIARPLPKINDMQPLQPLLKTMAAQGGHLMLVTHNNKTVGIITLEDLLEELVGEINDEFDAPNAWSLQKLLTPEAIDLEMTTVAPHDAIQALTRRLQTEHPTLDLKMVEGAILARETQVPTAIGKGVAIPHARLAGLNRTLIAIGRSNTPFAFTSPDKIPVRLIFLILTPLSSPLEQLRVLSRLATLVRNETLLKQLFRAKTPASFLETIRTSESIVAG